MKAIWETSEVMLQKAVQKIFSDPSRIWTTSTGSSIQILSPGMLNVNDGPDFLSAAMFYDGNVVIGNAEFHRKSSDWHTHRHSQNPRFGNVVLHIVVENDDKIEHAQHTLTIPANELTTAVELLQNNAAEMSISDNSLDFHAEIQHFALLRLLRKTAETKEKIDTLGIKDGFKKTVSDFLELFEQKRRRPVYTSQDLHIAADRFSDARTLALLVELSTDNLVNVPMHFTEFLNRKQSLEGAHLRRETVLNCVLPSALAVASLPNRIAVVQWYWSVEALFQYGMLKRLYPNFPQKYLWQQQGLLEYKRNHGAKENICKETLQYYGFGSAFSYLKISAMPIAEEIWWDEDDMANLEVE